MGKSSREFMRERELNAKKYPVHVDDCYKPCPECSGIGFIAESKCCGGSIIEGTCAICKSMTEATKCTVCNGSGSVDYTEEDLQNDKENEIIGNAEMMNDD